MNTNRIRGKKKMVNIQYNPIFEKRWKKFIEREKKSLNGVAWVNGRVKESCRGITLACMNDVILEMRGIKLT